MTMMSDLSEDLVEEILCRVSITSLGAVRSTCKGWYVLSKTRVLCKAETKHQFLGFMKKNYKLCSMRFDLHGNCNEEGGEEFMNPSIKKSGNLLDQLDICKVFQCDGLLLWNTRLVVWNPYSGQIRWIKCNNSYHRYEGYAIGYDNNRKHKILRFSDMSFSTYKIYDFISNSWRVLDIAPNWHINPDQRGASLKGNTYFFAREKREDEEDEDILWQPVEYLLCFDFTTENFGQLHPLPFEQYIDDAGALSSFGEEKLAALFQSFASSVVEIWVTSMIEANAVSWIPFLKVDMKPHCSFRFRLPFDGGSFFIDEEKKVAVVIHVDVVAESEMNRYEDVAYIIGENGSYVPSLAQINQSVEFENEREEEEAN
ncbi:F-box associated domain type 1 [Arabidopsis suecica]|uniref:F-box associated domain type 1 n=1 Tax=Arabidopsis suecica TaxID=45249 RepID=A0A8T2DNP0_ARASU|nr:F-box associated domain type 1 [Arabidopsis suecica]